MMPGRLRALFVLAVVGAACTPPRGPRGEVLFDVPQGGGRIETRGSLEAPVLQRPLPGTTFTALLEGVDPRVGFGGGRVGPAAIAFEVGERCSSGKCKTDLESLMRGRSGHRQLIVVRDGNVAFYPPTATTGESPGHDFVAVIGGPITTPELAAIFLWLTGKYELPGGTFETRGTGFSLMVREKQCTGPLARRESESESGDRHTRLLVAADGTLTVEEPPSSPKRECVEMPLGRRPEGVTVREPQATSAEWFARAAKLEAVSVPAFERLARELDAHGADSNLVEAAWSARRDEVRHAKTMATLAREHGASRTLLTPPPVGELPVRSLFEVARENAVEGCIFETFAALVATYQAHHAPSEKLRRTMDTIAEDETRHAELAWAVDAWCRERLSSEERAEIEAARSHAIADLRDSLTWAAPSPASVGEPPASARVALFDAMLAALPMA